MEERPFPQYSFLVTAAVQARAESRRFWRDKPSYPTKYWRIPADDPQAGHKARLEESLKRHRGHGHERP